ncbi:hypothetical protein BAUCODRAFT_38182 [Baudoinia panamericana UAMH 10762]|uniref:Uncharacterized protein n=1 Tax=Baudoinia panamericana (strain UAMH 10762) TaxID=717646 RepID=M2LDV0_BAUPA|nr:uncharacterized protein BAUCODRAFT_38182 [Baudoinia panamericana UAMH 10762]EMC92157.1 hypothetical protein BAUCODRAFT_38182 [Baudoinia panamericana UAMH 10762]
MASTLFARTLRPSITAAESTGYICQSCRRQESTYRRTRKALRVKPDPSFLPSKTETQDHIIFNPPSSAPSVYHTPSLFLPQDDPRRRVHTRASSAGANPPSTPGISRVPSATATVPPTKDRTLLPSVRPTYEKKYHVTPEQVEEIRRLRQEDPRQWTRVRLAERFECSQFFISLCCSAPEVKAEHDKALEEIKKKWGRRKAEAREARKERKKLWGMDA